MSFENQIIWITGASSGIGEALTNAFLQQGAKVILSGRRVEELERVAAQAPEHCFILPFESTNYPALPNIVERAWAWSGRVDMLINNAGISQRSLALDTHLDVYRQLIEVDYMAPLALTQLLLPKMVARKAGHLAVVSSVAGKVGTPLRSGYSGAKHAVIGYFDTIRAEVEQAYGITVSVILPGSLRTDLAVNALAGDGSARGYSDPNIENGMDVTVAAKLILTGLAERKSAIPIAEGIEAMALKLSAANPEQLYALTAQEGARLAMLREAGGSLDPLDIRSSS
ncbi:MULTISPECIES: SDR family NAD(P)-dependent oxidoreductase [unclassified Pseudomonas]|uniref:SDR family NAD(P)-dependent oxidoreductase n=1 Tax=unclassified Pseudomonas TaxID=196821 RepID=UPI0030D81947